MKKTLHSELNSNRFSSVGRVRLLTRILWPVLLLSLFPGIILMALGACHAKSASPTAGDFQDVTIHQEHFTLELATDSDARYQGLSDRESIAKDGGMLFVFRDAQRRAFVMRRCLVPIDIAFLDPGGRVVAMHEMQVEPYDTPESELVRYDSRWPARFAVEWASGTMGRLNLKTGDRIDLPLERLKGQAR